MNVRDSSDLNAVKPRVAAAVETTCLDEFETVLSACFVDDGHTVVVSYGSRLPKLEVYSILTRTEWRRELPILTVRAVNAAPIVGFEF